VRAGEGLELSWRLLLSDLCAVYGERLRPLWRLQCESARRILRKNAAAVGLIQEIKRGWFRAVDSRSLARILNLMVKYSEATLDRTFAALADPTRRALIAQLSDRDSLSVSELAKPFAMSLPAIMKHLDVLSDAGLLAREKNGRVVVCRLTAKPMRQAMDWLKGHHRFWSDNLDRLAALVEDEQWPIPLAPRPPPRDQASPSGGGSRRARRKSTRRGPIRRK
jgi:DNA-binding transcriptional ArsR family regulator